MADWLSFFSFLVGRIPQSWTYRVSYHIILEQAHNLHFYHHCLRKRTKKIFSIFKKITQSALSLLFYSAIFSHHPSFCADKIYATPLLFLLLFFYFSQSYVFLSIDIILKKSAPQEKRDLCRTYITPFPINILCFMPRRVVW